MSEIKDYMKSRFFKKITLSIMLVVFVVSGILVGGVYMSSVNKLEDISINLYKISLEQIVENIDMQIDYYDSKLLNSGIKSSAQKFFSKSIDTSRASDRELLLEIKNDSLDITQEYYVDHVIYYSYKNDYILDSSVYTISDYPDKDYIKYITSLEVNELNTNALVDFMDDSIVLTRAFPIASKNKTGLVSITLKKEAITDLAKKGISNLMIVTEDGREVTRIGDDSFAYNLEEQELLSIKESDRGWDTITIDQIKYYCTYKDSVIDNYDYVYLMPYSEFEEVYKPLSTVTIYLVIIMLFFGIMSILLISNYIYRPIKRVTDYFVRESTVDVTLFNDELELIKNVYVGISDNNKYMTELLEENKPIVKERFLYRLLKGDVIEEVEFAKKVNYFDINFPYAYFSVITFEYAIEDEETSGLLIMNHLSKEIRENGYSSHIINLFFQRFSLLLCHEKEFDIGHLLHSIYGNIEGRRNDLLIGVGNSYKGAASISLSFTESIDDLDQQLGGGLDKHYEQGEIKYNLYQQYFKYEKELFDALVVKSQSKMEAEIELILDELEIQEVQHIDVLRDVFLHLLSTILRVVVESGGDITKIIDEKQLYVSIRNCNQRDGFIQILKDLCIVVNKYLVHRETDNSQKVVVEVMNIINEHYSEDLHIAGLAEAVYLSSSHLARTFKKYAGKSINEYIHEIRIQEAKRLLLETKHSVEKIGMAVGYNNIQSFLRNFKKRVGISPNDFRQNNKSNSF